ncbi:MAG TPA: MFS transporter [Bacteroidota bacterium]
MEEQSGTKNGIKRLLKHFSPFHLDVEGTGVVIPEQVHKSMHYSISEGALAGVMAVFTGGVVLTGLALALGANEFVIGLIAGIQAGANLFQLRAYRRLERSGKRKSMAVMFATVSRLVWVFVAVLLLISWDGFHAYRLWLFILLYAASAVLGIYSAVPWVSWLVDLVPEKVRGRFFAQRNLAAGAVGVILGIGAGKFIDFWNEHSIGPATTAFAILIGVGLIFGFRAVQKQRMMYDPPFPHHGSRMTFWETLRDPFRNHNFRRLFYFRIAFDFSMGVAGTFYGVYMLTQANLSFTFVAAMAMITTLMNFIALKPWGRILDRFGNKPVLQICVTGKILFAFLWLFTSPETLWLYPIIHLFGVFDAGIAVAIPNLVYKTAPVERRSNYIAVDGTVVGIAATIAPLIGGGLAMAFADQQISFGLGGWRQFHLLFMLALLLRIVAMRLLSHVQESDAKRVVHVIRVISPVTGIDMFEGFQQVLHSVSAPARYVIERLVDRTKSD